MTDFIYKVVNLRVCWVWRLLYKWGWLSREPPKRGWRELESVVAREKQALGFGDDKKLLKLLLCGHKFYVLSPSLRVFENHLSNYPDELQVLSGLTAVSLPWAKYVLWPHLTSLSRKRTVALLPLQGARDFRNINSGKWKSQRTYGCREYNLCNSKGWTVGNRNLRLQVFGARPRSRTGCLSLCPFFWSSPSWL